MNALDSIRPMDSGLAIDPLSARRATTQLDERARAEAVAEKFESVFMGMMVKAMRATVPEGGLTGGGMGGSLYVEMLDQQLVQQGGLPRDPRFREALVRQIMNSATPDEATPK